MEKVYDFFQETQQTFARVNSFITSSLARLNPIIQILNNQSYQLSVVHNGSMARYAAFELAIPAVLIAGGFIANSLGFDTMTLSIVLFMAHHIVGPEFTPIELLNYLNRIFRFNDENQLVQPHDSEIIGKKPFPEPTGVRADKRLIVVYDSGKRTSASSRRIPPKSPEAELVDSIPDVGDIFVVREALKEHYNLSDKGAQDLLLALLIIRSNTFPEGMTLEGVLSGEYAAFTKESLTRALKTVRRQNDGLLEVMAAEKIFQDYPSVMLENVSKYMPAAIVDSLGQWIRPEFFAFPYLGDYVAASAYQHLGGMEFNSGIFQGLDPGERASRNRKATDRLVSTRSRFDKEEFVAALAHEAAHLMQEQYQLLMHRSSLVNLGSMEDFFLKHGVFPRQNQFLELGAIYIEKKIMESLTGKEWPLAYGDTFDYGPLLKDLEETVGEAELWRFSIGLDQKQLNKALRRAGYREGFTGLLEKHKAPDDHQLYMGTYPDYQADINAILNAHGEARLSAGFFNSLRFRYPEVYRQWRSISYGLLKLTSVWWIGAIVLSPIIESTQIYWPLPLLGGLSLYLSLSHTAIVKNALNYIKSLIKRDVGDVSFALDTLYV